MLCINKKCAAELPEGAAYCHRCGRKQDTPKRKPKTRGNGTGTAYRRGETWTAAVVVGKKIVDGKKVLIRPTRGGFETKRDALAYIVELRERRDGKKPISVTLESMWETYKKGAYKKLSANKKTAYEKAHERMSDIFLRDITILTVSDIQDCVDKNAKTFYPAREMKSVLSHCYQLAAAQQIVLSNLSRFIVLPPLDAEETMPFNETELNNLWAAYGKGDKIAGYALIMIYSGMMPGELFIAKKDMIDWSNQSILGCGLKTKKRKSTPIVIANFMMPVLKDLCDYAPGEMLCALVRDDFYAAFKVMIKRCECREGLSPYSCRHTTATALALGNIAPSVIQEIMRQTKFTTTQKYIHIDTAKSLAAVNTLRQDKDKESAS